MDYATQFVGKIVEVTVDRSLGSKHPKYDYLYPVNYGHIKGVLAPDKEEVDAYILGINKPIGKFVGKCIAVIHRINDDDDKLIVVPEGLDFSDVDIKKLTKFQEKYFSSNIIR